MEFFRICAFVDVQLMRGFTVCFQSPWQLQNQTSVNTDIDQEAELCGMS